MFRGKRKKKQKKKVKQGKKAEGKKWFERNCGLTVLQSLLKLNDVLE